MWAIVLLWVGSSAFAAGDSDDFWRFTPDYPDSHPILVGCEIGDEIDSLKKLYCLENELQKLKDKTYEKLVYTGCKQYYGNYVRLLNNNSYYSIKYRLYSSCLIKSLNEKKQPFQITFAEVTSLVCIKYGQEFNSSPKIPRDYGYPTGRQKADCLIKLVRLLDEGEALKLESAKKAVLEEASGTQKANNQIDSEVYSAVMSAFTLFKSNYSSRLSLR